MIHLEMIFVNKMALTVKSKYLTQKLFAGILISFF